MSKKQVTCNKCGATGLVWHTTKAGKYYLTDQFTTEIKNGQRVIKTLRLAHQCKSAEEQEIAAGFQQAADKAHALEAQRDAITAQIDALLDQEGELADADVALVRTMSKQRSAIAGEIQALQDKFNDGWKF